MCATLFETQEVTATHLLNLPQEHRTKSVNKRKSIDGLIRRSALAFEFATRDARRVNEKTIGGALAEAVVDVVANITMKLREHCASRREVLFIFDGEAPWCLGEAQRLGPCAIQLAHADDLMWEVAAAGFLAKERCDVEMLAIAKRYPQYEFEKHKGYGTARHRELLRQHGPCPEHRFQLSAVQDSRESAGLEQ